MKKKVKQEEVEEPVEEAKNFSSQRVSKIQFFMQIAKAFSEQSTCCRKHVGAILVKDGRIVSTGYNGVVRGATHCNEYELFKKTDWSKVKLDSKPAIKHHEFSTVNELHAEQNAIAFAAKNGLATDGCTLFTTLSPCPDCSKLIVAAGIKEVYYLEEYDRCSSGINFLKSCGIYVERVNLLEEGCNETAS